MNLCDFLNVFRHFVNIKILVFCDQKTDCIFEGVVSQFDLYMFDYDNEYWNRKVLKCWIDNGCVVILID